MENEKKSVDKENILFGIIAAILIAYALFTGYGTKENKEKVDETTSVVKTQIKIEKVIEDTCSVEPIIYIDENYTYSFDCSLAHISVNNKIYSIVKALEDEIITIKDLESNGFLFNRTVKEGE